MERKLQARTRAFLRGGDGASDRGGNFFLWTIAILLLGAFAIGCWIFSFYIFGHPEKALSYDILSKLKKLEPPKRFELTAAPRGDFLDPAGLWDRYNKMSNRELARASEILLRNYLRNYKLTQDHVPYVVGNYTILDSYELTAANFFPSGVVALARSTKTSHVLLEQVFTADKRVVPVLQRMLLTGLDLRLDKSVDLSALVNIRRLDDGCIQFTAIPLLYGNYAASTGSGTFSLEPPARISAAAGLPILQAAAVAVAVEKLTAYHLRAGLKTANSDTPPQKPQPQLVRVERPKPVGGGTPPLPASTPPLPASTPLPPVLPAEPVNPAPGADVPTPPTLQPFISPGPSPASIATTAAGNWPTYTPGQMPRGRLLNIPDMTEIAGRDVSGERIYLQGNFVVTASGQNRAVLRSQGAIAENLGLGGKTGNTRVIVEYPTGDRPPAEGDTFSRDSRRPFLITDVRKGADGQVNVYVREVTRP